MIAGIGIILVGVGLTWVGVSIAVERGPVARFWMAMARISWGLLRGVRDTSVNPFTRSSSYVGFTKWFGAAVITIIGLVWVLGGIAFLAS